MNRKHVAVPYTSFAGITLVVSQIILPDSATAGFTKS